MKKDKERDDEIDKEIIHEFLDESLEMLGGVEPVVVSIMENALLTKEEGAQTVQVIFRGFHSIKGNANMLNMNNISSLTHEAEQVLDIIRSDDLILDSNHAKVIMKTIDLLKKIMDEVRQANHDQGFESEVQQLIKEIRLLNQLEKNDECKLNQEELLDLLTPDMIAKFVQDANEALEQCEQILLKDSFEITETDLDYYRGLMHGIKGNCGFMGYEDLGRLSHEVEEVFERIHLGEIKRGNSERQELQLQIIDTMKSVLAEISCGRDGRIPDLSEIINRLKESYQNNPFQPSSYDNTQTTKKEKNPENNTRQNTTGMQASGLQQGIRVNLKKLDTLINLIGELVIAETMVSHHPEIIRLGNMGVERVIHQLHRVSQELQDVAVSIRMVPLTSVFQKMIRLVHDLSLKSGKQIKLELLGEETEVDKTVIELISDPLVHIIRNAVDHGIELPEERRAQAKESTGHIKIEARHEGGEVWIIIQDDGHGLNRAKILERAHERGVIKDQKEALSEQQIFNLIFEPGFSTVDKVTDLSGRGVGMDVVKKNIEKLKGQVDVHSTPGEGSMFVLRIPLTLAIVDGMLIRVGQDTYILPMLSIKETFRPFGGQVTITPEQDEIVRVRDSFYPVIRLHELFKKEASTTRLEDGILVVVEWKGKNAALFVDELLDQQESVIKGLSGYLGAATYIAGCTILGNGEVSLILDVGSIVNQTSKKSLVGAHHGNFN